MRRADLIPEDLLYLCKRMRADEIEQYLAITHAPSYDFRVAAVGMMNIPGVKFSLLGVDDLPVVAGGYEEVAPGVWQSWMVGTEDGWAKHWRSITKETRRLMDELLEAGAVRLQTTALASRTLAHRWYTKGLGMQYEGTLRRMASGGRDVSMFARVKEG